MPGDGAAASDGEDWLGELEAVGVGELEAVGVGVLDDGPGTGVLDALSAGVVAPEEGEWLAPGPAALCVAVAEGAGSEGVVAEGAGSDGGGELVAVGCSDGEPEGAPVDDDELDPVLPSLVAASDGVADEDEDEGVLVASGVDEGVVVGVAQVAVTACSAGAHSDAVTAGDWSAWATAGTASTPRPDRPMTPRARAPRATAVTGGLEGRGARLGSSAGSVGADPRREGTAGGTARAQDARSLPVREVWGGTRTITRRGRGASS